MKLRLDGLMARIGGTGITASIVFDQLFWGLPADTSQGFQTVPVTVRGQIWMVPIYPISKANAPGIQGAVYDINNPFNFQ